MALIQKNDELMDLEDDFANLVRLSAQQSIEDVRLLLAKLVRKYRTRRPSFAERINEALRVTHTRSAGPSVLRRGAQPPSSQTEHLPVDADSRMPLIRIFDDRDGLESPLLSTELLRMVQSIIRERRERTKLDAHGIRPTRSAILVGPPGVGKTLSARWIAAQLGKPLWVLDLTTVMSSLLGKTGNNLRMVFDAARANEAVLLLDEVDAIAKRRSDESDVGELKRLVTAILQEVDAWPDTGLLLAATNHSELIDPALWRRFDAILKFDISDQATIELAVQRFLGADLEMFRPAMKLLAASLRGTSLSNVERAVNTLRRSAVLDSIEPAQAVLAIAASHIEQLDKQDRLELAIELARNGGLSHNKIMELTGVARDTIRRHAGPSPIKGRAGRKGE
jgi:hypothetical protein